jgi:hypothetical protein
MLTESSPRDSQLVVFKFWTTNFESYALDNAYDSDRLIRYDVFLIACSMRVHEFHS